MCYIIYIYDHFILCTGYHSISAVNNTSANIPLELNRYKKKVTTIPIVHHIYITQYRNPIPANPIHFPTLITK